MPQTCVFLPNASRSGSHVEVLVRPHAAGEADAGLHLVEDEQRLVLVREVAQRAQELGAEVVVAALGLDRLDA